MKNFLTRERTSPEETAVCAAGVGAGSAPGTPQSAPPCPCSTCSSRLFHHGDAKDLFFPKYQAELRPFPAELSFWGVRVLHVMSRCSGRWGRSRGGRQDVWAGGRSGARPPWVLCSLPR